MRPFPKTLADGALALRVPLQADVTALRHYATQEAGGAAALSDALGGGDVAGAGRLSTRSIEKHGRLVGVISLGADLRVWVAPPFRGGGIGFAASALMLWGHFRASDGEPVLVSCKENNNAATPILARLGFSPVEPSAPICSAQKGYGQWVLSAEQWHLLNPVILEGERVRLRPLVGADAPALSRIGGDLRVAPMLCTLHAPWPQEQVRRWIESARWRGHLGFRFGVDHPDHGLIGVVGMGGSPLNMAYFLAPELWGNGYAREAVKLVLDWAGRYFSLRVVEANHFTDNPASGRLLRALGFREMGAGVGRSSAREGNWPMIHYEYHWR